jgi:aspartate aminotransferase
MNRYLQSIEAPAAIEIADRIRKKEADGELIFKVQTGEPCFNTPDYISNALFEAINNNKTNYSYSQGLPELRKAISFHLKQAYSANIDPTNVFITNGGVHAIHCAIQSLIEPGEEVMIFDPSWPQYANITKLYGGIPIKVSTRETSFVPTIKSISDNITSKTRMVIFNSPNNPTGKIIPSKMLQEILHFLADLDVYILFDEVYDFIVYEEFQSILSNPAFEELKNRIIYINSFSKTFCMTGWRLGYAIVPPELSASYLKLLQNSVTHVNTFVQLAGVVALRDMEIHKELFKSMMEVYNFRRNELIEVLTNRSFEFVYPEGSFYFFIRIPNMEPNFVSQLLSNHKIASVPGEAYGKDFSDYFRISYAVDKTSYDGFLNWLSNG